MSIGWLTSMEDQQMKKIEKPALQLRKLQLKLKAVRILDPADLQQIKGGGGGESATCDWDK